MTDQQRPGFTTTRGIAFLAILLVAGVSGAFAPASAAPSPSHHATSSAAQLVDQPPTGRTDRAKTAAEAAAVKGYVYWGYYLWNDKKQSWDYATVGANDKSAIPKDGDVYGFRWALVVKEPRFPRADGDFDAICGDTPAKSGAKRVAFVIDYGSESDAVGSDKTPQPQGVCAVADKGFTAQQALQAELPVRTGNGGLICGIDDYPSQDCGSTVANAQEPPSDKPAQLALPGDQAAAGSSSDTTSTSSSDDDSSNKLLSVGVPIAVVVLLGVGALVLRRRQS